MNKVFLFLSLLLPSVFSGEKATMTAEDVARLGSIGQVVISPDGKYIAYQKNRQAQPFEENSASTFQELWVWDETHQNRPFVTGDVRVSEIKWRPVLKTASSSTLEISFRAKRFGEELESIYAIPVDGGEARKIVSFDTSITSYSWHPTGQKVAFLAQDKKEGDIKELEEKGFNQQVYEEAIPYDHLFVFDLESGDPPQKIPLDGSLSELNWSPDGEFLSVAIAPSNLVDDHYMYRHIHILKAKDYLTQFEMQAIGKMSSSFWSPDSRKLAFISGADMNDPSAGRVFVVDLPTGQVEKHFLDYPGQVESLHWLDRNSFRFLASLHTGTEWGIYNLDQKRIMERSAFGPLIVSGMSLTPNGQVAALRAQTALFPFELFRLDLSKAQPEERLTDTNPWLSDIQLGKQEVISYKASDGLVIDGILIYPVNYQKGETYPLILTVHGGPEGHYSNGFLTSYSSPGQVASGQGYYTFYPNYRGSTGRGLEFSKLSQGDAAGKEFEDLVNGVDFLIEQGMVKKDSVGVTGGSYGGYATAWCSTYYSDRFAAGVMFVGISNKISKVGTTDIPDEEALVHALSRPWDHWQFYLERSPVYYVQKSKTPLLIMHGKEDPRVNPGQSMELYRHLKTLGQAPVRLVFYPGEGHGNRKSSARYDYNLRMMRWFNHFLKNKNTEKPDMELEYPAKKNSLVDSAEN